MSKRITLIFILLLILTIMIGCERQRNESILDGYDSCEEYYEDGFQDSTDYCKYFYSKDDDQMFVNSDYYEVVTSDNIDYSKKYFENFPYECMPQPDKYNFDISTITEGDYIYVGKDSETAESRQYTVSLYDIENSTLYYIHHN